MPSDAVMVNILKVVTWGLLFAMYGIPVKIMNNYLTGSINLFKTNGIF